MKPAVGERAVTPAIQETKVGEWQVQGLLELHSVFKASLGILVKIFLKTKQETNISK